MEVSVREEPALLGELAERLRRVGPERPVSVTDLLVLRRAYWRSAGPPVEIAADRRDRIESGRSIHRRLGPLLGADVLLEVRVQRDGIVGRLDALADVPVEIKSGSTPVDPSRLLATRPDHVEQLGMYCALAGPSTGRLVELAVGGPGGHRVAVGDVEFGDLDRIRGEMRSRAGALREALARRNPSALPRCRWFDRGCEFQEGKVCRCSGEEPVDESLLLSAVRSVTPRPDVADRLADRLRGEEVAARPGGGWRVRDLLYPRRAYFERTAEPAPASTPAAPAAAEADLYSRIASAIESGPVGEVSALRARSREPEEDVPGFRGRPFLLRVTRVRDRIRTDDLLLRAPQYALELGFRCAVTGSDSAHLVLGYERSRTESDRLACLELTFRSRTPFARRIRLTVAALDRAVASRDPSGLTACPAWMYRDCPYREACACGVGDEGRSQR